MKALVHTGTAGLSGLKLQEIEKECLQKQEVRVKIIAAGLNHRDLFALDQHAGNFEPMIVGADGAGMITEIGEDVTGFIVGEEVVINPGIGWGDEQRAPAGSFTILGNPTHGTFAEEVTVPVENVAKKPGFLTWEEAATLSLSALTAYRALFTQAQVTEGMKVLIPGAGGGTATFLIQFAKAVGASVYVTSRFEKKLERALEIGADKGLQTDDVWKESLDGEEMDVVIESVGAATFNKSLEVLKKGGTIVIFGSSTGDTVEFNLRQFFYGQYTLRGSTMGSKEEYQAMLDFVEKRKIRPVMDKVFDFKDFKKAYQRLESAKQTGKIGLIWS